jgi:hypothetical protein
VNMLGNSAAGINDGTPTGRPFGQRDKIRDI